MMIYTAEKALADYGAKVPAEIKQSVEEKITALKSVKDGADVEAVKTATRDLSLAMQKIGEVIMKAGEEQNKPPEEGEAGNGPIRDADVK